MKYSNHLHSQQHFWEHDIAVLQVLGQPSSEWMHLNMNTFIIYNKFINKSPKEPIKPNT